MKFGKIAGMLCVLFTSNCAAVLIADGTVKFASERKSMWRIKDDVADGTVTPVALASLPTGGSADFAGHFAIYDGSTGDRELLFGNVAMNYDFAASTDQLSGKLSQIKFVDDEGQKYYGQPVPKIEERFTGSVAISGTFDTDSIPVTGTGNIKDESGNTHTMTFAADPEFYQSASGDYVLSSPWASGTLAQNGGSVQTFDRGYMGTRQSP